MQNSVVTLNLCLPILIQTVGRASCSEDVHWPFNKFPFSLPQKLFPEYRKDERVTARRQEKPPEGSQAQTLIVMENSETKSSWKVFQACLIQKMEKTTGTLFKILINAGEVKGSVIIFGYMVTLRLENAFPMNQEASQSHP